MIGPLKAAVATTSATPQPQHAQNPKPEIVAQDAKPASQKPSSAEASKIVQAAADTKNDRGADLQQQLNQQPQNAGTGGINKEAVKILEKVKKDTSSAEEFRSELTSQLAAAGQDPSKPIMDIRV